MMMWKRARLAGILPGIDDSCNALGLREAVRGRVQRRAATWVGPENGGQSVLGYIIYWSRPTTICFVCGRPAPKPTASLARPKLCCGPLSCHVVLVPFPGRYSGRLPFVDEIHRCNTKKAIMDEYPATSR